LLPLSGQHATASKAIQEGFLSAHAYYEHPNKEKLKISVYDSSGILDIKDLYAKALSEGAEFVVGPLTKPETTSLAAMRDLRVPVLALNKSESRRVPNKFFQFALRPEAEASALAAHAYKQGQRQAGILAVDTVWAKRISEAFKQSFVQLGGQIVSQHLVREQADLAAEVRDFLGIDPEALKRMDQAKRKGEKIVEDLPHPREDLKMIFLVAPGSQARQLRPMLSFYFAGHIPVYAASTFYGGTNNPKPDRDMNGVIFAEMPWLLEQKVDFIALRQRLSNSKLKEVDNYERLYAMGVDAYQLIYQLPRLLSFSEAKYRGLTGELSITQDHMLQRQFSFAKIVQGEPRLAY
jgi:outer membrane PBP1 activator LpoA protein